MPLQRDVQKTIESKFSRIGDYRRNTLYDQLSVRKDALKQNVVSFWNSYVNRYLEEINRVREVFPVGKDTHTYYVTIFTCGKIEELVDLPKINHKHFPYCPVLSLTHFPIEIQQEVNAISGALDALTRETEKCGKIVAQCIHNYGSTNYMLAMVPEMKSLLREGQYNKNFKPNPSYKVYSRDELVAQGLDPKLLAVFLSSAALEGYHDY
jgi:hypothetical protein